MEALTSIISEITLSIGMGVTIILLVNIRILRVIVCISQIGKAFIELVMDETQ